VSRALRAVRGLYFITAEHPELGRMHAAMTRAAIAGGARVVQFRDKSLAGDAFLVAASEVRDLCRAADVPFVVNDDAEAAMALHADGLHLGQGDLAGLSAWRPTWDAFLGISASSLPQALAAVEAGADYLGVGPVFPTGTKLDAQPPMGVEALRAVCEAVDVPVAAIGGICAENVAEVVRAGAAAVCVISAVTLASDPERAAGELAESIQRAGG